MTCDEAIATAERFHRYLEQNPDLQKRIAARIAKDAQCGELHPAMEVKSPTLSSAATFIRRGRVQIC